MNRALSMIAALVLLAAAAQPLAGTCCMPPANSSRMMAAMPCCAGTCPQMKAAPHQDEVNGILTAASPAPALAPAAPIAISAPVAIASIDFPATHQESPPAFLLHEQFRI